MFEYEFMRRAFVTGALLAVIVPCIGVVIVLKRLSMIGDALAHTSLAGVALGLIFGFNPILGAICACMLASFGIEGIRKRLQDYSEISIAVILSAGVGLAGVLSGFVKSAQTFDSFLFGSIVAISDFEMFLVTGVGVLVLAAFFLLYKELFCVAFDEQGAAIMGIPVRAVDFVFTLLTAVTVSVASRTVGSLIVSSLMVVPVACAMQLAKSYRQTVFYSAAFGLAFVLSGLTVSYYAGLKPGGTIVLIGVAVLIVLLAAKKKFRAA